MASLDSSLGIHDDALRLRSARANLLASNIANAETPHYKARDVDFRQLLSRQRQSNSMMHMASTHSKHVQHKPLIDKADLLYRIPLQPSLDGNTVDAQQEYAAFAENTLRYQASLKFLGGRFKSLRMAIKGE